MIVKDQKVNDSTDDVTSSGSYGVCFLLCSGRELNFRARSRYEPHEWLPYDYSSVMHYRAVAFSKDHLSATVVPKDRRAFFSIGQRVRFSPMDLAKLNILYNCSTGYYRGGDVPSPASEAGNDIAPWTRSAFWFRNEKRYVVCEVWKRVIFWVWNRERHSPTGIWEKHFIWRFHFQAWTRKDYFPARI